jgi:Homeodomain-like domain
MRASAIVGSCIFPSSLPGSVSCQLKAPSLEKSTRDTPSSPSNAMPRPECRSAGLKSMKQSSCAAFGLAVKLTRDDAFVASAHRAALADKNAWARARRPKCCKLANSPRPRRAVAGKLRLDWSPEQIAGWLKRTHPEDGCNQVSHETIYRSLFVQTRGVLNACCSGKCFAATTIFYSPFLNR